MPRTAPFPVGAAALFARRSRLINLSAGAALAFVVVLAGAFGPAFAQSLAQAFTPREESPEEFPPGPGREETFYTCTACHGFKLVAQQGMSRWRWDETLDWMKEKHGMPPIEGNDRKVVLDYLEATYPPSAPSGPPNPFLNR